ncbi:MAG: EAL domain-containing protein [Oscillospiraceae bacterium]|nr:EAL domain-containing protein [Oscillospiraceae bacterium]
MRERVKTRWNLFRGREFSRYRTEVNRSNRLAMRVLAYSGVPLSIANILAQSIIRGLSPLSLQGSWLLAYFVILVVVEHFLPEDYPHATALIYLIEAPVLIVSILLGTVWDPDHQALTFMMFLMAMPVFILDRPLRLSLVTFAWSAVFYAACLLVKNPATFRGDFFHLLEFFLAAEALTYVSLTVRMEALRNLMQARYTLAHDELTGAKNRRALEDSLDLYLGKPMMVFLGDLDQLNLYNDFYGHDTGNEILVCYAGTLGRVFGERDTYRYGGDEMLCFGMGYSEEEGLERIDRCREELRGRSFDGHIINLSCSFGYVTGAPETAAELHDMVRLADIYAHQARARGRDQTVGGPFDADHLREGIVASNMSTHAQSYEMNSLTGLPSMSFFVNRAEELLLHVAEQEAEPVVGFFNLIQFRDFNDAFGYAQGDRLIRFTAGLLRKFFPSRHVCYITGSRFGIVCYRAEVEPGLSGVNRALADYKPGFPIRSKAGFAAYRKGDSVISLLDKAKAAHDSIYERKDRFWRFYDARLDEENRFHQYIVSHLDEAIEKGWIQAYYQPIVRAVTGKVCNEEALARWDDPRYGFLSPMDFIPILEENRLLWKVSLHMVREVLKGFRLRREAGVPIVPVSVNLSRYDFEQWDMVNEISHLVDASGFPRSMLKIEITESALMSNPEMLKQEVNRFREAGFAVWMDDFGSEYSTLNLLQDLEFDLIKIDMQFMRNFVAGERNRIIVSDIVDMARRMGISTLIEGVETREQFFLLRQMGCERLQGFLFNRPRPQSYIIRRATSGTGLHFENSEQADYFKAMGRIDLSAPLSGAESVEAFSQAHELPAGVLEERTGGLLCVRSNAPFLEMLERLGLAEDNAADLAVVNPLTVQRENPGDMTAELKGRPLRPPEALSAAVEKCRAGEEWSAAFLEHGGRKYAFYLRKVARDGVTGALAMLAVVLPADPE